MLIFFLPSDALKLDESISEHFQVAISLFQQIIHTSTVKK